MQSNNKTPHFEDDFEHCLSELIKDGSFPSFDEFKKNPDKWRENKEQLFESIDMSMMTNRKDLARQKIYWRYGKEHFSLGKLERVLKENGYKMSDIDMIPYRSLNTASGRDEVFVRVFPKTELRSMGAVVAND